jgi:hypothetical protein
MIKLSDLKPGDMVNVRFEDTEREGIVVNTNREDNLVCVDNGVQEFWYDPADLTPLPLNEDRLIHSLGFEREETPEGVKYKRGPFRVLVYDPGSFSDLEVWYREDHRRFHKPLYVHELQNHYLQMTKVPLEGRVVS